LQHDASEAAAMLSEVRTREELEARFERAAAIAFGRPGSSDPELTDAGVVATVLVLREVMHHLGFTRLQLLREDSG
jgi:hypothetical protein